MSVNLLRTPRLSTYNKLMNIIEFQQIENDVTGFLRQIAAGEALMIVKNGTPIAETKPLPHAETKQQLRPIGLAKGLFTVPDDFDAPLPEEILRDFES